MKVAIEFDEGHLEALVSIVQNRPLVEALDGYCQFNRDILLEQMRGEVQAGAPRLADRTEAQLSVFEEFATNLLAFVSQQIAQRQKRD